jgi:hypothetical protein
MKPWHAYLPLWLALGLVMLWSCAANAQQAMVCGTRADMLAMAHEKFQETVAATGRLGDRAIIEMTLSEAGSFSLFASFDDGRTCLIATGDEWKQTRVPGRRASAVERMGDSIKPRVP